MKTLFKYLLFIMMGVLISCSSSNHSGRAYSKNTGHSKGKHCNAMKPHQKDVQRGLAN